MFSNCGAGEDSWECLGKQGDQTSQSFFFFNWRLITLQYCGGFCHTFTWISHEYTCVLHPEPLSPSHPSGSSQCTSPEHPVSCIEPGLAICFTYEDIHVSMLIVFWILWEKERVGCSGSMALKHVYYHMWNGLPVQVWCMRQGAQGWCTEMTLRDGMGREVGRGFRMGNTCTPMADSCQCMAKITTIL